MRLGAGEGFSHVTDYLYLERYHTENEGYKPSWLLNYLDFSLDLNLGDIFSKSLKPLWIGNSLYRRVGI